MTPPPEIARLIPAQIIEKDFAMALGLLPVAGPYRLTELWMLARVVRDLQRNSAQPVIVREAARHNQGGWIGLSVWRKP
jgi:hypothetical protein